VTAVDLQPTDLQPFDPYGPLPTGTTVLEASAGHRQDLDHRGARDPVRRRGARPAVGADARDVQPGGDAGAARAGARAAGLDGSRAGPEDRDDPLVRHLLDAPEDEVRARQVRLRAALSDFDRATIATTHSFCQSVLDGLGMSGDSEPGSTLVESVDDLLREVVDDLYLRKFAAAGAPPPQLSTQDAREVVRAAVGDRAARLEPADADPASAAGQRVRLAAAARNELQRRKHNAAVRDYDDLLTLLREVLRSPDRGPAACRRLRAQYRVVLVDEFQDTDPVQWEILRTAFHGSDTALVLIGDPKQAIYAFRGAEVLAYLAARSLAGRRETLGTNWRSDAGLLRALHHLYGGAALGHPDIVVRAVQAHHVQDRWWAHRPSGCGCSTGPEQAARQGGYPALGAVGRRWPATWRPTSSAARQRAGAARGRGDRPVAPGDIAVLVRRHSQALLVQEALSAAGVPCVLSGATSVFRTPAARDWLWLLQALEQPHRAGRVRLAALTPLLGWTAPQLDADPDGTLEEVGALLRDAARRFADAGFAAAVERLGGATGLERRLLGVQGGERRLTDLRHLAQTLDRAAVEQSLGLTALTGWLAERVEDPDSGSVTERSRRLETDAAAVQVVTVHASKGLEFPVVYVPYGWDGGKSSSPATLRLHDPDGERVLDVGGKGGPGWEARKRAADAEDDGEELRLLYVALTRAQCQVVAWWAPSASGAAAPLHRLLLGRTAGQPVPAARVPVPDDAAAAARLTAWGTPEEIAVEVAGPSCPGTGGRPEGCRRCSRWPASTAAWTPRGGARPTPP
jgi:exodeoxyribonuclease V beta subunit